MGFIIKQNDKNRENWNILFEQIVKGNVIPVIGPEIVKIGNKTSKQFLIDVFANHCGIDEGEVTSFSQLIYDRRYQASELGNIHSLLTLNLNNEENTKFFDNIDDNLLLYKFLKIPYFQFVITTTFDTIVENIMKKIHGDKLRVLCFRNDANKNDDILNGEETRIPTLYYMFGKADGRSGSFVATDTDLLKFSQSWLLPNDSNSNAKPSILSSVLSRKYLLVLGYDYQDWLFRFFWYSMKNDAFGLMHGGMLAHTKEDQELIGFLTRANAFSQVEPDMNKFVNKLYEGITNAEKENKSYDIPLLGADVFLSYSRGDYEIVEQVYKTLKNKGLNVWYDRQCMKKGLDFMNQIESAIKNSTFFVPVFTNTITHQADKEHPYRDEWRFAVKHIQRIGGIPYCFPFYEESFDMENPIAAIPADLKKHDAFSFSTNNVIKRAEDLANYLLNELKQRKCHD